MNVKSVVYNKELKKHTQSYDDKKRRMEVRRSNFFKSVNFDKFRKKKCRFQQTCSQTHEKGK